LPRKDDLERIVVGNGCQRRDIGAQRDSGTALRSAR
jgi:hypothetical protein